MDPGQSSARSTTDVMWGLLVGILGFGLGGVMSLIAVVAFGVLLGMRAHGRN